MNINLLKNKEKSQKTREKSTGRSMVEMLGVLAIIGVLSIGGISGYTIAMRRYRANEILQVANKYALTVYTQLQSILMNPPNDGAIYGIEGNGNWTRQQNHTSHALDSTDVVAFNNAGLGGLPSGLKSIDLVYINSKKSGDIIMFQIDTSDHELCKTIDQLAGAEGFSNNCQESDPTKTFIYFIMN